MAMAFARSKKVYDPAALYEYAVGALGRRMRTVAELKRLLRQKNVEGDREAAIEAVILKLKDQRYLNDTQYASMYATLRRDGASLGRQRVETDLKVKGVHREVIEKTVSEAYAGVDEARLARDFLRKKRVKPPEKTRPGDRAAYAKHQKETARIFRMLARAGFRSATIFKVMKQWNIEDELLTALEEERPEENASS